jgi:hypothetical protein
VWSPGRELSFSVASQPDPMRERNLVPSAHGADPYWRLWGDRILHTIHMRVLRHAACLAEADALR